MTSLPLISHRMFVAAIQDANGAQAPHAPVKEVIQWPADRRAEAPSTPDERAVREPGLAPAALPALEV